MVSAILLSSVSKSLGLRQPVEDHFIATYADLACYGALVQSQLMERWTQY